MEIESENDFAFMVTVWRHVGRILFNKTIKWSEEELRLVYFTVKQEEKLTTALGLVESGVRRVGGFSDILLSIEVVVQDRNGGQIHEHHICQKPKTLAEFENMEAIRLEACLPD
jgi:hypothetical protein